MESTNRYAKPCFTEVLTCHQVAFDKISERLKILATKEPALSIDHILVTQKVISGVYAGVTTQELDNLAAETAAYMSTQHPGTLKNS